MALEKSIIKAQAAQAATFDYKPRELEKGVSTVARDFVEIDAFKSSDFKISALIAEQAGISRLEDDALKDKINAQVLDKIKEIQEDAYKAGYELGEVEGSEKAFQDTKNDLLERLDGMDAILQRFQEIKKKLLVDNENELVKLVFLVAKKLAFKELEENREAVVEILRSVVGEIQEDERVVVRLSPTDLFFLEQLKEKGDRRFESLQRVKFVTEDKIKPGGCLIETEYGTVDATVEERVDRTWATLQSRAPKVNENKKD